LAIVAPLLIPLPPLEGTLPPADLADEDGRFIELRGIQVHYKASGSGEPSMILMHGFLSSAFSWREVIGPLSETGRVVAFDRPAFGLTERPDAWGGENPYTADFAMALTLDLMDALSVERAVLVGNSAGGALAARQALEHPERVQALILVDAAIYSEGGSRAWLRPLLATPQMRRIGPVLLRNVRTWGAEFGRSAWHDPARITPEIWAGYTLPLRADNWDRALYEYTLASQPGDLASRVSEIDMPVLVITGDDDRIVPIADSVRLASEIPNARLAILPACGHVPQEECAQAFLEVAQEFLTALP
jgi:pimeloyl-ACP methyl ester carboxylesterase